MKECTRKEIMDLIQAGENLFLFFFTPFCGTCKLAERMLDIILQMEPHWEIKKCNVNVHPDLCQNWKIASVPCILKIEEGMLGERLYRMHSVDELYTWLKRNRERGSFYE